MANFATLADLRAFLNSTTDYEKMARYQMKRGAFDLGRVERFYAALGAPQSAYECVHIAGTNGKGSTAWILDALLRSQGLSSGRYTSPHLERESERIVINGSEISEQELVAVFNEMAETLERFQAGGDALTYFEIMTAAALVAFRCAGIDVAILETGLGGRLDATNALMPALTIITTIAYDHMDKLGNTLEDIAYEKSGIIKTGIPLVTGSYDTEALDYVVARAKEMNAPLHRLGTHFRSHNVQQTAEGISFNLNGQGYEYRDLKLAASGSFQANNAALAIEALHELRTLGIVATINEASLREALSDLRLPGRCEIFTGAQPVVMLDAAHNVDAIRQTLRTFSTRYKGQRKVLLFASAADKDVEGAVEILAGHFDAVVLTELPSPRSMKAAELASLWNKHGIPTQVYPDLYQAFEIAREVCGEEGALLVTGSFYLAGPLRTMLFDASKT